MPVISTRGAFSAVGFGLFTRYFPPTPVAAGTIGIFNSGNTPGNTTQYTYATDAVAPGSTLNTIGTLAPNGGGAFGTTTYGIFCDGGQTAATARSTTQKYTYAGASIATSTSLAATMYSGSAGGNSTTGFINIGSQSNVSNIWTYAGDTVAGGPTLTVGATNYRGTVWGNQTATITHVNPEAAAATNKYTYSGGTLATSTTLVNAGSRSCATSNATIGIIACGTAAGLKNTTSRWSFAADTNAASTVTTYTGINGCAAGNDIYAIIAKGGQTNGSYITTTNKYIYSSAAMSVASALSFGVSFGEAVTNGVTGVSM